MTKAKAAHREASKKAKVKTPVRVSIKFPEKTARQSTTLVQSQDDETISSISPEKVSDSSQKSKTCTPLNTFKDLMPTKEVVILLRRLEDCFIPSSVLSTPRYERPQPGNLEGLPFLGANCFGAVTDEVPAAYSTPKPFVTRIATQIPSGVLETFGISSDSPRRYSKEISTPACSTRVERSPSRIDSPAHSNTQNSPSSQNSLMGDHTDNEVPQSIHEAVPDLTVNITDSGDGMALSESIDRRSLTPKSDSSDASFTSIIPSLTPVLNLPNHQPTETIISSSSVITNNYELFHGVIERIYAKPPTSKLHDLHHDPCIRRVAPYALRTDSTSDEYFEYAAVFGFKEDLLCCVVFGQIDRCLAAFAGHFLVPSERLFDPVNRIPASDITALPSDRSRVHLSLFGVPNKTLIDYDGYFVRGIQLSYAGLVSRSLEMFLSALDQLRLQERTRFEVIYQFHSGGREGASNNSSCRSRFLSKMAKKGVAKQRKKRHMTSVKEKKRPVFIVTDLKSMKTVGNNVGQSESEGTSVGKAIFPGESCRLTPPTTTASTIKENAGNGFAETANIAPSEATNSRTTPSSTVSAHVPKARVRGSSGSNVQTAHRDILALLKERRRNEVFSETTLRISEGSVSSMLKFVKPMSDIRSQYGELATFGQICATDTMSLSKYYAAYEGFGYMSFYSNAFPAGRLCDRFVVAIIVNNEFFIMATRNLFQRGDETMTPLADLKEKDVLIPLQVPPEQTLAILELRQILADQQRYSSEVSQIEAALGIKDFVMPNVPLFIFDNQVGLGATDHGRWLKKLINIHFTKAFQNSHDQFPTLDTRNPCLMFAENVIRSWVHKILRQIHGIPDSLDLLRGPVDSSVMDLFSLDIFDDSYLKMFGVSSTTSFQCQHILMDKSSVEICRERITVKNCRRHLETFHTRPLLLKPGFKSIFTPFFLVPKATMTSYQIGRFVSTVRDVPQLHSAKNVVDRFKDQNYLDLIKSTRKILKSPDKSASERKKTAAVHKAPRSPFKNLNKTILKMVESEFRRRRSIGLLE